MKLLMILSIAFLVIVQADKRIEVLKKKATTHSIFGQIQAEISKLKLPASFFQKKNGNLRNQKKQRTNLKLQQKVTNIQQQALQKKNNNNNNNNNNKNKKTMRFKEITHKKRLNKKLRKSKQQKAKLQTEFKYGSINVHVQLPTKNVDELIKMMDYDKETHCVFKEGFVTHVVKSDCSNLWVKPAYILLTPESLKLCEKAEEQLCFHEVKLCEVSHIFTPNDWQSSPCFQVRSKNLNEHGEHQVLAQLCASDYPAAMGWQQAILSYHRCNSGQYQH